MSKQERVLFLIESPNKIATLKNILPSNYIIMASIGHISKIRDGGKYYNSGIDISNNFEADYVLMDEKKDIIKDIKNQIASADKVILSTDGDREGELISYMLKKLLRIPEKKYERITFHEITKPAVLKALSSPRKIDNNLALAAMSRAKLDKLAGYMLSPVARRHTQCRSVGRCQSAGLKLIVDREEEIQSFTSKKYFELYLSFIKDRIEYKAKYIGKDKKKIDHFEDIKDIEKIVKECKKLDVYKIVSIESKDRKILPKLPFTTSTFQQEVANKLGLSVKQSMSSAQRLFEGINVGGKHIALITYIRTDSSDVAPEFADTLSEFVKKNYGKNYYSPIKKAKKQDNTQDGHEAIRVIDLNMTPDKLSSYINDDSLIKIYSIIYNRTVASSMSPAIITDTEYVIKNGEHKFVMSSHALKFDGFKKVYGYKDDNEEELSAYAAFKVDEITENNKLFSEEKTTKPPKRYSEASFVGTLEKLGIGRPSTYASILETLLDKTRGYCELENKVLTPTEKGIALIKFLDKEFPDIVNSKYTSNMEKDLDLIAEGSLNDVKFLSDFYTDLEAQIKKLEPTPIAGANQVCPTCGAAMVFRRGKYGPFLSCSAYPKCKTTKKL